MVAWRYKISLLVLKKIFHSFAALTREIFFTRREILYLRAAMLYPLFLWEILYIFSFKLYFSSSDLCCQGEVDTEIRSASSCCGNRFAIFCFLFYLNLQI